MNRRKSQLVPVIIIVLIVVVSVAAIVSLARTIFFSGGSGDNSSGQKTSIQTQQDALLNTQADRAVRMTVRGPITANEKFRSYQITITPSSRNMTTFESYLDQQIDTVQLDNNVKAYEQFVFALNRAGMMSGKPFEGDADDTRGICSSGKVLEFETLQNAQTVTHLWTTTCSGTKGSLTADSSYLGDMFLKQVPQGPTLLKKINAN